MATWRSLTIADIPNLMRIADQVHPGLPERSEVFAERIALFPAGCLALADGETFQGYAISHPTRRDQPPALDCLLGAIAPDADQYYIHDLALCASVRGRGYAAEGIRHLLAVAAAYSTTCLVSVYGTASFWHRFGFQELTPGAALSEKLRDYGSDAVYLCLRNQ